MMLNYHVRPGSEASISPYLLAVDAGCSMGDSRREGYTLQELQQLASTANSQYLDLESAENELAAWIRNANRGPQAEAATAALNNRGTLALPTSTWNLPFHNQPQKPQLSAAMYEQPESQYSYLQDPTQTPSFYPPPPSGAQSPVQPYYQNHPPSYHNDANAANSSYAYPSGYPSPSAALSPSSSSTDPELKRIRNTAASARFRAKKKRREASLERNAKDKRETLERLELRIRELEAENQFLKGLIFDKEKLDGVKIELERARELKRDLEMERGEGERDDGVGTTS